MHSPPSINQIKEWLSKHNPLGSFKKGTQFLVSDIDPKPWSGHFNYLVESGNRKFVLWFKGPEWGDSSGAEREFKILKKLDKYKFGPKVYYFNHNFFSEPVFFEEYIDGKILNEMSDQSQQKCLPEVARFIARINATPFRRNSFPFQEDMTSYTKNKHAWRVRLETILDCRHTKTCGKEILAILPGLESRLEEFERRLDRVLSKIKPAFIFESAHIGHCVRVKDGFRFYNWEQVSFGDPSYTLAVFLTSIKDRRDFPKIKKKMIENYLKVMWVPEFWELLEQRMWEREVSNTIYGIWNQAKKSFDQKIQDFNKLQLKNWIAKLKTIEAKPL